MEMHKNQMLLVDHKVIFMILIFGMVQKNKKLLLGKAVEKNGKALRIMGINIPTPM